MALVARLPLSPLVVVLGLLLAVSTGLAMRGVERSLAEAQRGRDAAATSASIETAVVSAESDLALLTDVVGTESFASSAAVQSYLRRTGTLGSAANGQLGLFEVVAVASVEDDQLQLLHMSTNEGGVIDTDIAIDLVGDEPLRDAVERAQAGSGAAFGFSQRAATTFDLGEAVSTAVVVAPAADNRVVLALISPAAFARLETGDGTDSAQVLLSINDVHMASLGTGASALDANLQSAPMAAVNENIDRESPYRFEAFGAQWVTYPRTGDLLVDHSNSWMLLLAGTLLAFAAGMLARAVRSQSILLGRLDRQTFDATHDSLTGLLNRSGLTAQLEERLTDRRSNNFVGVLFLDLDRLKVVNDSMGHSAGDEVLRIVSERLLECVREDDIVARFGGDEFVVVSSGVPAIRDLTGLAERMLVSLKEPARLSDDSNQMIGGSIGISYVTNGEADAESLLRDADLAMYRAKESGGGRYEVFDAELRAAALARLEVERELRKAIRTGQLLVHYQPIVNVATGMVTKLEALVRWKHPERGMIPPGAFLSVAAESGLIVDVGEHVLREACRQAVQWTAAIGRPVSVAVNVAERQLIDGHLVETVKRVLAETNLDPSQLELEISEELIVERLDGRLHMLYELVGMGVRMALDDFGTSRASLSSLKKLDMVHTLKIDRAFVIDVATDPVDRKIITAIVALAHSVGMEVVAEGVEDADQATVLKELGVAKIQGFYFARPDVSQRVVASLSEKFALPWDDEPSDDTIETN